MLSKGRQSTLDYPEGELTMAAVDFYKKEKDWHFTPDSRCKANHLLASNQGCLLLNQTVTGLFI